MLAILVALCLFVAVTPLVADVVISGYHDALLREPTARLIALDGPGGVGQTSLEQSSPTSTGTPDGAPGACSLREVAR